MAVRVRFVVAAGPTLGRGHLGRALSLTEAAWPPGTESELALESGTQLTQRERSRLEAVGTRVVGAESALDPRTVVIVDVPEPDEVADRFERERLVVFDDRETFSGSAAIVVQPSLPTWSGRASAGRVLTGWRVVPIAADIRRRRAELDNTKGQPHGPPERPRVVVCFGGSDPDRVTARLTPALAAAVGEHVELEVVIGGSYTGPTTGWPVAPVRDPADLVERLATADLVVGGAGTMKFEIACLGRAMLLLAAADDQRPVGPAFAATGAARYLGDGRTIDPDEVGDAVNALLEDAAARSTLAATAARIVDGAGGDRLAAAFVALDQGAGSS